MGFDFVFSPLCRHLKNECNLVLQKYIFILIHWQKIENAQGRVEAANPWTQCQFSWVAPTTFSCQMDYCTLSIEYGLAA